jgi:hypothetical protein
LFASETCSRSPTRQSAIDAALGSTAIAGTVETLIVMRRNDRFRSLVTEQREGEGFSEEVTLDFDEKTRSVSLGPTRKDADEQQAAAAILEWLKTQDEPVTREAIEAAVEGRTGAKRAALKSLFDSGKVTRTGEGKRGDPHLYVSCSLVPPISRKQENTNRART